VSGSITLVVLAGGASRRMGTPKAQLVIGGQTLLARAVTAGVAAGAGEALVVGGLTDWVPNGGERAKWVPDRYPGEGPLGGLVTGLEHATTEWMLLLSCDFVTPDADALRSLVNLRSQSTDVVIPDTGRLEVLHALYRVSALEHLRIRFEAGERRMQSVVANAVSERVLVVPAPPGSALARSCADVDTPEQFQTALREH
jgi:molybdenum cofactor guanylyltransferase